jgi:hypothetical protein
MIPVLAMAVMRGTASSAWALSDSNGKTYLQMSSAGVTTIDAPGATDTGATEINVVRGEHESELTAARLASIHGTPPSTALAVPNPPANAVNAAAGKTFFGFNGLTHADQRLAGTGAYANSQFSLEPPDQALCVGNGFLMEAVNTALAVYSAKTGALLGGPTPLNQFFNLAPEIIRPSGPFGDFTADPKCYFDAQTRRWFLTMLQLDVNPATGDFSGRSHVLLAVSQTANPTRSFNLFRFDVTNDGAGGTPNHVNCPCFGDQPLLGADRNGLFITTNEFPIFENGFNGAQIYAMSKWQLAAGVMPTVVHFDGGPLAEGLSYSVQPATSPDLDNENDDRKHGGDLEKKGVEYFLSALEFTGTLDNRIAVWAMTNTGTLKSAVPDVELSHIVIRSEVYGQPPPARQKVGPTPLGTSVGNPEERIETNDDRMNQVVLANGLLWAGLNTVVAGGRAGIAWFAVKPSIVGGHLRAEIANQGYVSVARNSVFFPSIGVNEKGEGVVAFSLSGPNFYPSAAYAPIDAQHGAGDVRIAAAGVAPEDGFTGYPAFGGDGVARWGDYSAAVADEKGNIWFATEYIPAAPRMPLANWGTFIGEVIVKP